MKTYDDTHLIWIDLEMTGLNPLSDRILEIATIVTTTQLAIVAEGPVFAIRQEASILDNMDDWNKSHHQQSGLIDRVKKEGVKESYAQSETLSFLSRHVPAGQSPMCGNSICQDRRFLSHYMPELEKYFHYRHLDVSTLKILAGMWSPHILSGFSKSAAHLALIDIRESIEELRYYQKHLIKE